MQKLFLEAMNRGNNVAIFVCFILLFVEEMSSNICCLACDVPLMAQGAILRLKKWLTVLSASAKARLEPSR